MSNYRYVGSVAYEDYFNKNEHWSLKGYVQKPLHEKIDHYSTWFLTLDCNFRCEYCYNVDTKYGITEEWKKIVEFYEEMGKRYDLRLQLCGGEPSMHPNFLDIINSMESIEFNVFTNLNYSQEFLKEFLKGNWSYLLTSFHYSGTKEYESYLRNLQYVLENDWRRIYVHVMWELPYKDKILEFYNKLKKLKEKYPYRLFYFIMPINYTDRDGIRWFDEQFSDDTELFKLVNYIDNRGNRGVKTQATFKEDGTNNFKGMMCSVGRHNTIVDSQGNAFYCVCHSENKVKPIFNIVTDKWKLDRNWDVICIWEECNCDIWFPKWRRKC